MKKNNVQQGKYDKLSGIHPDDDYIVYAYKNNDDKLLDGVTDNPNKGKMGFGFNAADGGVWIPLWDISNDTQITEVEFVDLKEENV